MRKKIFKIPMLLLYVFIGWFIIIPLIFLINPFIRKKYIVFIGRDDGKFVDNVKYLYLYFLKKDYLKSKNINIVFLTEDKNTYLLLKTNKLPVVIFPSFKAFYIILKTKILIVDNLMWIKNFKAFLFFKTKKIQLWHGIGFKFIELMNKNEFRKIKNKIRNFLILRFPYYYTVISTSEFYTKNVFSKAFKAKYIWETGYPRNDIFFRELVEKDFINVDKDIYNLVLYKKNEGFKVIIYMPTFRDYSEFQISNFINFEDLNNFCRENKFLFIIKAHPNLGIDEIGNLSNVIKYNTEKDIYPLLKEADCLITDYSSVFMDFLLLNRPIIFFPFDFETYITKDREFQFNYDWITPGPKVYTQKDLQEALEKILIKKEDKYEMKRKKVLNIAFKYIDGDASKRLLKKLLKLYKIEGLNG